MLRLNDKTKDFGEFSPSSTHGGFKTVTAKDLSPKKVLEAIPPALSFSPDTLLETLISKKGSP
jgi:hypothetical protein